MKKRILSLMLALVVCLGLLPMAALAADDDFVIEDGVLYQYRGPGGDVTIPSSVTSIRYDAFRNRTDLTSVTIPNSVTSIEERAFIYCSSLTGMTIPGSVTSIGNSAFFGCSSLTSVTIQNGVTSIGEMAFCGCSSLTSVTIPGSVTSIGREAFFKCTSLISVTIPNGVTRIGNRAFWYCSSLTSVTIPGSVIRIGDSEFYSELSINDRGVFEGCTSLTSVTIQNGVRHIGGGAFANCTSLTSVTVPSSVTSIGDSAFRYCSSLTSVTIPSSVTSIGISAFRYCSSLTDIYYGGGPSQWEKIGNNVSRTVYIHYNSAEAATPTTPTAKVASPSTQTVTVDGKKVEFAMYALNNGSVNYIRVRDLAAVLNGTSAQFNVGWNGNVTLTSKTPYDGDINKAPFVDPMTYTDYTTPTYVDGNAVNLEAIQIEYNGGGFTYYKLRDLAQALNFNVSWSADKGIFVETNKPYDPNN